MFKVVVITICGSCINEEHISIELQMNSKILRDGDQITAQKVLPADSRYNIYDSPEQRNFLRRGFIEESYHMLLISKSDDTFILFY